MIQGTGSGENSYPLASMNGRPLMTGMNGQGCGGPHGCHYHHHHHPGQAPGAVGGNFGPGNYSGYGQAGIGMPQGMMNSYT